MRHDGAGTDNRTTPNVNTVKNGAIRADPDVTVDLYALRRQPLSANGYVETFKSVIRGDKDSMCSNADIIANIHATVSIDDRERVEAAVASNPDVSAEWAQDTKLLNDRVVPDDERVPFRTSKYPAEITNRNIGAQTYIPPFGYLHVSPKDDPCTFGAKTYGGRP